LPIGAVVCSISGGAAVASVPVAAVPAAAGAQPVAQAVHQIKIPMHRARHHRLPENISRKRH